MKLRSNEPFWLIKNGLINSYPSLRENISTDVLIVGSGITGSLIAHQCVKDGHAVVVVDRREAANGSTSATTSMLQYEIDKPLYELIEMIGTKGAVESYRACFDSIDNLKTICREIRSKCGFKKKNSLYYAAFKKDVEWLKNEFEIRSKYGFPVKWLDRQDIENEFSLQNTHGGILSKQGGSVDAFQLAHDLLAFNHKKGLKIYDKTGLEKVEYKRTGVTAITEHGNKIKAKKVIYCNGFESTEIIKEKFVDLLSTFAVVGERDVKALPQINNTLFWNTAEPYIYGRTTDDGRLLIGGEDEDFVNSEKRDAMIGLKAAKLEKEINKILPDQAFRVDFAWAGTFGETKDGLPYIGKHSDFPSAYFVLGFGGNGITFSVIGMEMVSAMLKGKKHRLEKYFRFKR